VRKAASRVAFHRVIGRAAATLLVAMVLDPALAIAQVPGPARRDSLAPPARPENLAPPARPESAAVPYRMPPLRQALLSELHNKIIHFPIVLTLGGALLLILARKRPELEPVAFWTVWGAALFTLAAYFSGVSQAQRFEGRPKEWVVTIHRNFGIAVGITQAVWVFLLLRTGTRRWAWIWGLLVTALVLVAAFWGGLVAHGRSNLPRVAGP